MISKLINADNYSNYCIYIVNKLKDFIFQNRIQKLKLENFQKEKKKEFYKKNFKMATLDPMLQF